jgi:hypothetical protein
MKRLEMDMAITDILKSSDQLDETFELVKVCVCVCLRVATAEPPDAAEVACRYDSLCVPDGPVPRVPDHPYLQSPAHAARP